MLLAPLLINKLIANEEDRKFTFSLNCDEKMFTLKTRIKIKSEEWKEIFGLHLDRESEKWKIIFGLGYVSGTISKMTACDCDLSFTILSI